MYDYKNRNFEVDKHQLMLIGSKYRDWHCMRETFRNATMELSDETLRNLHVWSTWEHQKIENRKELETFGFFTLFMVNWGLWKYLDKNERSTCGVSCRLALITSKAAYH